MNLKLLLAFGIGVTLILVGVMASGMDCQPKESPAESPDSPRYTEAQVTSLAASHVVASRDITGNVEYKGWASYEGNGIWNVTVKIYTYQPTKLQRKGLVYKGEYTFIFDEKTGKLY